MRKDRFAFRPESSSIHHFNWSLVLLFLVMTILNYNYSFAQDAPQYRFQRKIEAGELQREELVTFSLDTTVYANTQDSLNDLRIENAEGTSVPFVVRRKRETETYNAQKKWSAEDVSLKPIQELGLEIRLKLDADDPAPVGLRILTPLKNFEQRVNIFAINKAGQVTPLVKDEVIFDYSRFMDVRNVEIQLPKTDARSFRMIIDGLTTRQQSQLTELTRKLAGTEEVSRQLRTTIVDRPFRIDRIELWAEFQRSQTRVLGTHPYDLVEIDSTVNSETNQSIVNIKSRSQPMTQFEVVTPEQNFQRTARLYEVSSKGGEDILQLITETRLSQLNFHDIRKSELSAHFPRNRHARYQLVIDNGDNPALRVKDVHAAGEVDEIIFIAKKSTTYVLKYGNPNLDQPDIDTASIQALLKEDIKPLVASLGNAERIISGEIHQPKSFVDLFNNPVFIGPVVILMIAILVWFLYSAAQKVDQFPEDQSGS